MTYRDQDRTGEAVEILEKVVKMCTTMANLAKTYWAQGTTVKEATILMEAVERTRRILGEDHPLTQTVIAKLNGLRLEHEIQRW